MTVGGLPSQHVGGGIELSLPWLLASPTAFTLAVLPFVFLSSFIRPHGSASFFVQFHYDVMTDADLQAKPQVLLLGQYSTGKTSVSPPFSRAADRQGSRRNARR